MKENGNMTLGNKFKDVSFFIFINQPSEQSAELGVN